MKLLSIAKKVTLEVCMEEKLGTDILLIVD